VQEDPKEESDKEEKTKLMNSKNDSRRLGSSANSTINQK
jgi:hypothetical protein